MPEFSDCILALSSYVKSIFVQRILQGERYEKRIEQRTDKLKEEGLAREFINRIQNLRKDKAFEVTDKVNILVENNTQLSSAIQNNFAYICDETLADKLEFIEIADNEADEIELVDKITAKVSIKKQ